MVGIDTSAIPRFGPPLTLPRPRVVAEWTSTAGRAGWPPAPAGEGRPVMLIPGFLAGDQSLTRMAVWLRSGGYVPARSGIRWNVDCMAPIVDAVQQRLERAVAAAGRPALLVGQSRGGTIARAVAVLRPDLVATVVTLGSPLLDQLAVRPRTWPSIVGIGLLGTAGVPGLFSVRCLTGDCCARASDAAVAPLPAGVRLISVYSRSDEVVRWQACLDPWAEHVEVNTSHLGMGMARPVWVALAERLAA